MNLEIIAIIGTILVAIVIISKFGWTIFSWMFSKGLQTMINEHVSERMNNLDSENRSIHESVERNNRRLERIEDKHENIAQDFTSFKHEQNKNIFDIGKKVDDIYKILIDKLN